MAVPGAVGMGEASFLLVIWVACIARSSHATQSTNRNEVSPLPTPPDEAINVCIKFLDRLLYNLKMANIRPKHVVVL
jgi:hypothetical protein